MPFVWRRDRLCTESKMLFYFRSLACNTSSDKHSLKNHSVFDLLSPLKSLFTVCHLKMGRKRVVYLLQVESRYNPQASRVPYYMRQEMERGERPKKIKMERLCWGKSSLETPNECFCRYKYKFLTLRKNRPQTFLILFTSKEKKSLKPSHSETHWSSITVIYKCNVDWSASLHWVGLVNRTM